MQFVEKLRSFGYQVFLNKTASKSNYAVYTDGKRIAKMSEARFNIGGVNIGTTHKPCREYGTGFSLQGEFDYLTLDTLTKEKAEEGFCTVPAGWPYVDASKIVKYADFGQWKRTALTADQYDLEEE